MGGLDAGFYPPRSWARTLGRRIGATFPRAARAAVDTLDWLGRAWKIALSGFVTLMVVYILVLILWALNWAPLWRRLYSECMTLQGEADTVSEIFQHRAQCSRFAFESVKKAP